MTALDADTLRDLRRSVTRADRRPFPDDYVPVRPGELLALLDAAEAVQRVQALADSELLVSREQLRAALGPQPTEPLVVCPVCGRYAHPGAGCSHSEPSDDTLVTDSCGTVHRYDTDPHPWKPRRNQPDPLAYTTHDDYDDDEPPSYTRDEQDQR